MQKRTKTIIITLLIFLVLTSTYFYVILPHLKPKPAHSLAKEITFKISEEMENFILPIVNPDPSNLNGWKVDKGNIEVTNISFLTDSESIYAYNEDKDLLLSQKLNSTYCDYTYLKGRKVIFSFWFKPLNVSKDGSLNYAWAEIKYTNNSDIVSVSGNKVYPKESKWYYVFVVAYIPSNASEITILIHGNSTQNRGFHGYIDTTALRIWEDANTTTEKGQISISISIIGIVKNPPWIELYMELGFYVKGSKPYIIKSLGLEAKICNPESEDIAILFDIVQANDKNLTIENEKILSEKGGLNGVILACLSGVPNVTITAGNPTSKIYFSLYDQEYLFYGVKIDKNFYHGNRPIGGYAEWKYPSEWGRNGNNYVTIVLGGVKRIESTFSTPKNITFSLTVNWGEIISHNTPFGKYYSIRDAGTETLTLILIFTS